MRNLYKLVLSFLVASVCTLLSHAYDFEQNGIYYKYNIGSEPSVSVTYGDNKYEGQVIIPSSVVHDNVEYTVTSVGVYCFKECDALKEVVIPEGVTGIGSGAFDICYALESVSIPNTVTEIGSGNFVRCYALKNLTIPENILRINSGFCSMCTSLEDIVVPKEVTFIGWGSFANCDALKSAVISGNVLRLEGQNFIHDKSLTEVTCYAKNVPVLGDICFSRLPEYGLIDVLYVPGDAVTDYKNSDWAQYFKEILPIENSGGVDFYEEDKDNTYNIYNMSGIQIKQSTNYNEIENLPGGLYIINGKKVIIRK